MKHKSESLDCLKRYIQDMNISFRDHKVNTLRGLRSDNGGEYTGADFKNFCKSHGIRQDFGIPYGPQDNGVAEKSWHGIILNVIGSIYLLEEDISDLAMSHLMRRHSQRGQGHLTLDLKLIIMRKKMIRILSRQWGLIRKMRYYLLIQVRKTTASKMDHIKMNDLMIVISIMSGRIRRKWGRQDGRTRIVRNMNNMGRTRSKTKARERHRLDDGSTTMGGNLAFAAASEIVNEDYHLTEDESEVRAERRKARDAEYQAHMKNGTWELTPLPKGERCISSGWVEADKRDQNGVIVRRKARFIAKGYSQEFGYDYLHTYAPVASITTIRLVLALACILDLELDNMDVDTAYLQSDLEEKVYIKQPPGYEQYGSNGEELVCRLRKSLYGLKQSGRNWHKKIDGWFRGYGFHSSSTDPCLYVKFGSSGEMEMVNSFKHAISREFSMKDLKELHWILGMAIKRDREKRVMEISQTAYIDMMLAKFRMADCKPVLTPMEGTLTKMDGKDVKPDNEYMKLVGSLLYAALVTRPDIAFARVLRYLKGTREVGLKYTGNSTGSFTLVGYADADYAGDKDNRRSTSGYTFTLSHGDDINTIDWKAKQQDVVALSSAESELISACSATQSAVYIRQLLMDLGFKQDEPTVIMEDNQACIAMSNNPIIQKRTKHIDVRYHFVREKVESKEVELVYIPTQHQLADILTKPLSNIRLAMIRNRMMGYKYASYRINCFGSYIMIRSTSGGDANIRMT
ncbi:gag-pol polyprotein [Nannochloropsis gaditana]|uniref:Gag-pol polyprotein n=1 Tax=Nannochloropsis gaditana TaxID=72520 RepID=W7T0D1_9STRA|nr:gag-pol polyprotein [Nannochloropsis gaditana]